VLIRSSGGLSYHLRALRYRNTLWAPFRRDLSAWLEQWRPRARHIHIVGCSGGYCLDPKFIARFDQVTAWDLDPLARLVFERRFQGAKVSGVDALSLRGRFAPERLSEYLPQGACVLFTNVLGQLVYELKRGTPLDWSRLYRALGEREWASFHDRLSGFGVFRAEPSAWEDDRALSLGFEGSHEVESHETERLYQPSAQGLRYLDWQITPDRRHRIEAFSHSPTETPQSRPHV
jgi:hypothetical protein